LGRFRILIIDESDERAEVLRAGLEDAGHRDIVRLKIMQDLVERIAEIDPEVILIDLENPNRDTIEQMFRVSEIVKRPIAMFVDESDPDTIKQAVRAGVSAYVVNGLARDRVRPIVDTAITRFETFRELETRAVTAERALEERKVIERAKGILMKRHGLDEGAAHARLRDAARARGRRMADVAESILTAEQLL